MPHGMATTVVVCGALVFEPCVHALSGLRRNRVGHSIANLTKVRRQLGCQRLHLFSDLQVCHHCVDVNLWQHLTYAENRGVLVVPKTLKQSQCVCQAAAKPKL